MTKFTIDDLGAWLCILAILLLAGVAFVYVPRSAVAIPRSEDDIRQIIREEMERAKTGAAPAEERR